MFNFTTTTFINNASRVETVPATGELRVKSNHLSLKRENLVKNTNDKIVIYKKAGCVGVCDTATISLNGLSGSYRLAIYVRPSMSDQDSYLSNALVFKGKPFYVEFKGGENVADLIRKYELLMVEKPLIEATQSGNTLTLTATRSTLRFTKVELQKLMTPAEAAEENVVLTVPNMTKIFVPIEDAQPTITRGHEEFGTYHQLSKDVVLPTWEHRRWATNQEDEQPIPGALYSQYTIRMCVNRGVMGGDAVGEVTKSLTTHIFWVKDSEVTAFETALEAFGTKGTNWVFEVKDAHDSDKTNVNRNVEHDSKNDAAITPDTQDKRLSETDEDND